MVQFEVIRDPLEDDLNSGLLLDERHERLVPGEFVLWLNRILGRKDLMMYRHKEIGSFMLCQLIREDPPIVIEVDSFDAPPDWIQSEIEGEHFWKLRLKTTDQVMAEMKEAILARRAAHSEAREDSYDSRTSTAKYLKRRGMDEEAHLLKIGATQHVGEAEAKLCGVDEGLSDLRPERRIISVPKSTPASPSSPAS